MAATIKKAGVKKRLIMKAARYKLKAGPVSVRFERDDEVLPRIVGEAKTRALKGVRVENVKVGRQQILGAYTVTAKTKTLEMLDVGPHENFYRGLTHYLDARLGTGA
jgi:hypothetical protein